MKGLNDYLEKETKQTIKWLCVNNGFCEWIPKTFVQLFPFEGLKKREKNFDFQFFEEGKFKRMENNKTWIEKHSGVELVKSLVLCLETLVFPALLLSFQWWTSRDTQRNKRKQL